MARHGQEVFASASLRLAASISRVNRILSKSVSIAIREKAVSHADIRLSGEAARQELSCHRYTDTGRD